MVVDWIWREPTQGQDAGRTGLDPEPDRCKQAPEEHKVSSEWVPKWVILGFPPIKHQEPRQEPTGTDDDGFARLDH